MIGFIILPYISTGKEVEAKENTLMEIPPTDGTK
jgi:hypothetical protein